MQFHINKLSRYASAASHSGVPSLFVMMLYSILAVLFMQENLNTLQPCTATDSVVKQLNGSHSKVPRELISTGWVVG